MHVYQNTYTNYITAKTKRTQEGDKTKTDAWKTVEELGMASITDGCTTEQIKWFCEKHKLTYYALTQTTT